MFLNCFNGKCLFKRLPDNLVGFRAIISRRRKAEEPIRVYLLSLLFFFMIISSSTYAAETVTLKSLLDEMLDRTRIATYPEPEFVCKQFSSYDPASKTPGNPDWFANDDRTQFLRVEDVDGHKEWVLMDADGPGAIVRWWITGFRYDGIIRIYIDDQKEPVIQAQAKELIGGDALVGEPLSAVRSRGLNLYLPIPYQKNIKVTYCGPLYSEDKSYKDRIYYNINYRQYPKGTKVQSFTLSDLKANHAAIADVQKRLLDGEGNNLAAVRSVDGEKVLLKSGQSVSRSIKGAGAICSLKARINAEDIPQAMRSTVIQAQFDGQECVWVPIGEFFGTGLGVNAYQGWWRQTDEDGWMSCRWPMPFQQSAAVTITNYGNDDVTVELGTIGVADWDWNDRTMYFHSSWRGDNMIQVYGAQTDKMQDWNYITVKGKGVYAGDTVAVFNRATRWWGEGDEKVFVDGESFPSHFGTGSEDYFGYAWCWHEPFSSPFHAQPNGAGNKAVNHTTNTRVRLLDQIPFKKSIQFDMELWHWATNKMDYASTTYWYAFEGAGCNGEKDTDKITQNVGNVYYMIQAEDTQIRKVTGGSTRVQEGKWKGLSEGGHFWWTKADAGDEWVVEFEVGQDAEYAIALQCLTARNYGRARIMLDGKTLLEAVDFYEPNGVIVKKMDCGTIALEKGPHLLSFTLLDKNPSSSGNMVGFDFIEIEKQ